MPRLDQCDPSQLAWLVKEIGQLNRKPAPWSTLPRSPPEAAIGARSTVYGGEREPLLAFQPDSLPSKLGRV